MTKWNPEKALAFKQQMVSILNQGAMNLAIAIGYRIGLLDAMADLDQPATAEAISAKCGQDQRYTQEWLAILTAGDIIEISEGPATEYLYYLPREHAACLSRSAGNQNLAVYAQEIPILTDAMEAVIDAFRHGDGLPYSIYTGFQAFMSELSNTKHHEILVEKFLPDVANGDLVRRLQGGIRVCDIGCGGGVALLLMAEAYPRSRFTGFDISSEAIASANALLRSKLLENAEFLVQDAATLKDAPSLEKAFDYIVAFDAIHDQVEPAGVLKGIYHLLADGGLFSMVDIAAESQLRDNLDHSMAPFLYTVSLMHCLPVGRYKGGEGLGMMWGKDKAVSYIKQAGFSQVDVIEMPHDPFNFHYLCRK